MTFRKNAGFTKCIMPAMIMKIASTYFEIALIRLIRFLQLSHTTLLVLQLEVTKTFPDTASPPWVAHLVDTSCRQTQFEPIPACVENRGKGLRRIVNEIPAELKKQPNSMKRIRSHPSAFWPSVVRRRFSFQPILHREVVPLSGTGETLILSIRKDINDGSEEDCCKGRKDTSALHR